MEKIEEMDSSFCVKFCNHSQVKKPVNNITTMMIKTICEPFILAPLQSYYCEAIALDTS